MKKVKRYWMFLAVAVIDIGFLLLQPATGQKITNYTVANFREMLSVLPPIFLLLGLMDVWVPKQLMIRLMGEDSGLKGTLISILLGAASAGPLYGAFPVAVVMLQKGASLRNVFTFLSSWATLKIPMFLFETAAMGPVWSITRWIASVAGTVLIAAIMDKLLSGEERSVIRESLPQE